MSGILATYEQLGVAYEKRTLKLLRSRYSRIYLAMFKTLFPDTSQSVEAGELYSRMDECLSDLDEAGYTEMLPHEGGRLKTGRSVCHDLIDEFSWVESKVAADGRVEYRLTSDAIEALNMIERLRGSETLMTGSRMRTILEQIDHAYVRLSPDYDAGLRLLQERVASALEELDRYEAAGGGGTLSATDARDEIANLIDLMGSIPVDLRRLEEDVRARAVQLIERFRNDDRPTGVIIGEYLDDGKRLLVETDHGRSFVDSLAVIGDPSRSGEVDLKLDSIANAPVFERDAWEHTRRIQDGWNQVVNGITWVNRENGRSSHAIRRSISHHDVSRDRELTATLKELEAVAYAWAGQTSARTEGPIVASVAPASVSSLRDKPHVGSGTAPPPQLASDEQPVQALSIDELRRIGGPLTAELLAAIAAQMALDAREVDLAACFSELPDALRRPVEIAGFLQMATRRGIDLGGVSHTTYECVDLDGRAVRWRGPKIVLTSTQFDDERQEART